MPCAIWCEGDAPIVDARLSFGRAWLHHAPQMRGTDVDAPFNFLADQFSRKYDETMAGLDSMGI